MGRALDAYSSKLVNKITSDGRITVRIRLGVDQVKNIILKDSQERAFLAKENVERISLSRYIIRGDKISLIGIGERDEELDRNIIFSRICVDSLPIAKT